MLNIKTLKDDSIEVLVWEGVNWAGFGKFPKEKLELPNFVGHEVSRTCPISCDFTTDRSRAPFVDAVLFEAAWYGMDVKSLARKETLRFPHKRQWQKWVNFGYETPHYFPLLEEPLWKEHMDIGMTYTQEGDDQVPVTLTCMWGGGNLTDLLLPPPEHPEEAPVIFMTSNCGSGGATTRTKFVKELMNHIKVDSYGKCLHNRELPEHMKGKIYNNHGKSMSDKIQLFRNYKFAIVFENKQVKDYVSEKLMCALQAGTVPIYMGAENIDDWTPGEHSFINANSFTSPKELAEYLHFLLEHPEEYAKYFEWKKKGFSDNFLRAFDRCVFYGAECRLCQHLAKIRKKIPRELSYPLYALAFDRTGVVEIDHQTSMNQLENMTMAAWIQPASFLDYRIFDKNSPGKSNGFRFGVTASPNRMFGKLRFCFGTTCLKGEQSLDLHRWYHVAVTFEKERKVIFFVDGEIDSEHSIEGSLPHNSVALRLGSSANFTGGWDGSLDELFVFSRTLSQKELKKTMFVKLTGKEQGLAGYWPLDEGSGQIARDASHHERHGTLLGAVSFFRAESKPVHFTNSK